MKHFEYIQNKRVYHFSSYDSAVMDIIENYVDKLIDSLNFHLKVLIPRTIHNTIVHSFHLPDEDDPNIIHIYLTYPLEYEKEILKEISPANGR